MSQANVVQAELLVWTRTRIKLVVRFADRRHRFLQLVLKAQKQMIYRDAGVALLRRAWHPIGRFIHDCLNVLADRHLALRSSALQAIVDELKRPDTVITVQDDSDPRRPFRPLRQHELRQIIECAEKAHEVGLSVYSPEQKLVGFAIT